MRQTRHSSQPGPLQHHPLASPLTSCSQQYQQQHPPEETAPPHIYIYKPSKEHHHDRLATSTATIHLTRLAAVAAIPPLCADKPGLYDHGPTTIISNIAAPRHHHQKKPWSLHVPYSNR